MLADGVENNGKGSGLTCSSWIARWRLAQLVPVTDAFCITATVIFVVLPRAIIAITGAPAMARLAFNVAEFGGLMAAGCGSRCGVSCRRP